MKIRNIYTQAWVRYLLGLLCREFARSVAFGFLMLLSMVFLFGCPLLVNRLNSSPSALGDYSDHNTVIDDSAYSSPKNISASMVGLICLGLPLAILCWWGAMEVADDRHWENSLEDVWENRQAHSIANTINFANQLRARGMEVDTSALMTEDIYSQAHRFIESVDEKTLRLYMAAMLATTEKHKKSQHASNRQHQSKRLVSHNAPVDGIPEENKRRIPDYR